MESKGLNKAEFISEVAKKSGHTSKDVQMVLRAFQTVLLEELGKHSKVNILDLGQFKISERSARSGVNPQTREKITIAAKKMPRLAPSRKFKDFVANSGDISEFNY